MSPDWEQNSVLVINSHSFLQGGHGDKEEHHLESNLLEMWKFQWNPWWAERFILPSTLWERIGGKPMALHKKMGDSRGVLTPGMPVSHCCNINPLQFPKPSGKSYINKYFVGFCFGGNHGKGNTVCWSQWQRQRLINIPKREQITRCSEDWKLESNVISKCTPFRHL